MAEVTNAVLFAILLPLGTWALFRFSQRTPEVDGDAAMLRYGPAIALLGWVCFGIAAVSLGAFLTNEMQGASGFEVGLVSGVGVAFFVAGLWMLAGHAREYVRFSKEGVEGRGGLQRLPTVLRWAEIECVEFSSLSGYLILFGPDGRNVRVSALLHGSDDLASFLYLHARARGVSEAVHLFRQYRAAYGITSKR